MEDFIKSVTFIFNRILRKHDIAYIRTRLKLVEGIESFDITEEQITVNYDSLQLAGAFIKDLINNIGYPVRDKEDKGVGVLKRFINNLAKNNQKAYGTKKLDCCELKH